MSTSTMIWTLGTVVVYFVVHSDWLHHFLDTNVPPVSYNWAFTESISVAEMELETTYCIAPGVEGKECRIPLLSGIIPPVVDAAIFFSIMRLMLGYFILKPLALYGMQLQYKAEDPDPNAMTLTAIQARNKNRYVDKKVTKFVEAAWRGLFYGTFIILAFDACTDDNYVFHSWFFVSLELWDGVPFHPLCPKLKFFFMVELGSYLHQLLWTEVKRKDALEMIIHHIVTILLIGFSYSCNFWRIGCVIMVIHDIADVFLESAKCCNYIKTIGKRDWAGTCCDVLFGCFALSFFITRLVIFPGHIGWSVWSEGPLPPRNWWGALSFYIFLLIVLQILHIFWFSTIAKMIYKLVTTGIEKDERSDDDSEREDESLAVDARKSGQRSKTPSKDNKGKGEAMSASKDTKKKR